MFTVHTYGRIMTQSATHLIRLWLPDRPGALGAAASRLGGLKGDVLGLEIIERGGGLAIDELVVALPEGTPIDLVVRELSAEEGVEVEDIRSLDGLDYDPQLEALEVASILLGAESREDLAMATCVHVGRAVRLSWACITEHGGHVLASWGDRPNDRWLDSFISGSPAADTERGGLELDTIWIPLPAASAALIVGGERVLRARERQRLAALGRIADAWFCRLRERSEANALRFHPSGR